MTDASHNADWFEHGVYEQTSSGIRTLKASLPEEAVRTLAKEVLRRVAQQVPQIPLVTHRGSHDEIERLCLALTSKDRDAPTRFISKLKAEGVTPETIYLTYLAGAARLLGEWWDDNRVSFVDVTIGTSRIYSIMRGMSHLFVTDEQPQNRAAVFAAVPGEIHTLGVSMAADLFRKDGWDIELLVGLSHDELIAEIARSRPRLIGLSSSGHHSSLALAMLVVGLRVSNPGAFIMVSGQTVVDAEDIVLAMDIDGTATDFRGARATLNSLWNRSIGRKPGPQQH
jgi:methanogenic corrinoid protein MtbC1